MTPTPPFIQRISLSCYDSFYINQADSQDYSGKGEFFYHETFELTQLPELVVYMFEVVKAGKVGGTTNTWEK